MKIYKSIFLILMAILLMLLPLGCYKNSGMTDDIYTGKKYGQVQIVVLSMRDFRIAPITPDWGYQWVNQNMVSEMYSKYRKEMFSKGVVSWDVGYDCNKFSSSFYSFYQTRYFVDSYKSGREQSIAVGEFYYKPDISRGDGANYHAINIMVIEGEFKFFEPQTGKFLNLSEKEKKSATLVKF